MNAFRTALNVGSVALVAVLGWMLVRSVLGLANPESLYEAAPVVAPAPLPAQSVANRDYDFSTDPFSTTAIIVDLPDPGADAPETTLNLIFKGGITEGRATVQMPDGRQKNIAIGEEIMNGVTLKSIGGDFVTLDVNGEIQRLTLERIKMGEQGGGPIIGRAPAAETPAASPAKLTRSDLPSRDSVQTLLSKVEVIPYLEPTNDGFQRRGVRIKPRDGFDLSQFGLQSDDVLVRIGPVLLDRNRVNIAELRDMISTGAAQDIEIIRDGTPITLRIGQ